MRRSDRKILPASILLLALAGGSMVFWFLRSSSTDSTPSHDLRPTTSVPKTTETIKGEPTEPLGKNPPAVVSVSIDHDPPSPAPAPNPPATSLQSAAALFSSRFTLPTAPTSAAVSEAQPAAASDLAARLAMYEAAATTGKAFVADQVEHKYQRTF